MSRYFVPSSTSQSSPSVSTETADNDLKSMQAEIEQLAEADSNSRSQARSQKISKSSGNQSKSRWRSKSHFLSQNMHSELERSRSQSQYLSQKMHSELGRLERENEEEEREMKDLRETIADIKRHKSKRETFKRLTRMQSSPVPKESSKSTSRTTTSDVSDQGFRQSAQRVSKVAALKLLLPPQEYGSATDNRHELTKSKNRYTTTIKSRNTQSKKRSQKQRATYSAPMKENEQVTFEERTPKSDHLYVQQEPIVKSSSRSSASTSIKQMDTGCNGACKYNMNVYEHERLQKENQALTKEVSELKKDIRRHSDYSSANIQKLKVKIAEVKIKNKDLRERLKNNQYKGEDESQHITDLKQQIVVLQSAVINYDNLKEAKSKLESEYNEMLENAKESRKEKAFVDKQLIGAQQHIENMEINIRQLNHEKMSGMSEMRAMKNEFEQERKNISDRYDRIVQKYEAELTYAKKMYQQTKRNFRELQYKFENEQPQFEKLREELAIERDEFQKKLNNIVIDHVGKLDLIGKQSSDAVDNAKWANDEHFKEDSDASRAKCFSGCSCD